MVSHIAWLCSYYADAYKQVLYDGKDLLYWCKREIRWAADWLLKTHRFNGAQRPAKWNSDTDHLVIQACPLLWLYHSALKTAHARAYGRLGVLEGCLRHAWLRLLRLCKGDTAASG
jgi:hypothetical protein